MVDIVNKIAHKNYNIIVPNKSNNKVNGARVNIAYSSTPIHFTSSQSQNIRTELASKEEKQKYTTLLNFVDKNSRKQLELLLKTGILLNDNSNDKSTVLDNLYTMATTPRAKGLNQKDLVRDTIATISYPFLITQQFGDIPAKYRDLALTANAEDKSNLVDSYFAHNDIDVEHSGTCVAASIEFNLAEKMPAEFTRFAQGLSSPDLQVKKKIQLNNLADHTLDAIWLLNAFEIPYETNNFNDAILTFAPDKNAIIRATIQTTDRDAMERSPLDVLMQSTFMQTGSQQAYNTLTDKRGGKFNQNDKGLIEFEKTFIESVVENKNKLSVTYQKVDENARLVGYEKDKETLKRHLLTAIDMGENVIIGYTQVDRDNNIINGHEITLIGYKYDQQGKLVFICNDTDDDISKPIEYGEDYLLPKIHHAALPQKIVEAEMDTEPAWKEGLKMYQQMKREAA